MPREFKIFITCDDDGSTREFPRPYDDKDQIWEVDVTINMVGTSGHASKSLSPTSRTFFVTRKFLERLKMLPVASGKKLETNISPQDEVRETLEKLLSLVGVYPVD